jgi:hypothetical protein
MPEITAADGRAVMVRHAEMLRRQQGKQCIVIELKL